MRPKDKRLLLSIACQIAPSLGDGKSRPGQALSRILIRL
jgi:hypothetical protein